jgi:sugar/nucleoside kinase (ribokinase family)
MSAPDFVVCGHAARDIVPGGWRMGGTVTFAAVQAHRLGMSVGVVTAAADDFDVGAQLPFAQVLKQRSDETTTFENHYDHGQRKQRLHARASRIDAGAVPREWRAAAIALIGPVFGEIDPAMTATFAERTLVGVSPQGWLRALDADGNVVRAAYDGAPFWRGADAIFVSDEDLLGGRDDVLRWTEDGAMIAMTESGRGAQIYTGGAWKRIDAFPEDEVDPTGAGDTFATAFLIRLRETGDTAEAARFAAAAASLSVGGVGVDATPSRAQIEERMRRNPEVALR